MSIDRRNSVLGVSPAVVLVTLTRELSTAITLVYVPLDNYDTVRSVSVESVESGCTRTSRQFLDCMLPLINL
jgi:hypothetical protein